MASSLPASLKFIRPLAQRIHEVEATHPLVAYFCRMECVSKIINSQIHTKDPEAAKYAEQLMTELETFRADVANDEQVKEVLQDEDKSKQYMLTFATGILAKGQQQIASHNVTMRTATTLLAAASFLEVCNLWSSDETENVKFAKYHAARIIKAVKQGEDPNDLFENKEHDEQLEQELDEGIAQLEQEQGLKAAEEPAGPEEPAIPESEAEEPKVEESNEVTESKPEPKAEQKVQEEPNLPTVLPSVPEDTPTEPLPEVPEQIPGHKLPQTPSKTPNEFGLPEAPESQPVVFDYEDAPKVPDIDQFRSKAPEPKKTVAPASRAAVEPAPERPTFESVMSEAAKSGTAQKHAKYAISALNYDDYSTAIRELEAALSILKTHSKRTN